MIDVIIFDFDGTIANTLPTLEHTTNVLNALSKELGFKKLSKTEVNSLRDYNAKEIFKQLRVPLYRIPFVVGKILKELKFDPLHATPVEGAKELLTHLKRNRYRLGIITSNKKEKVTAFLEKNNLAVFDFVHSGKNIFGKDKVIRKVLSLYTIPKETVLYVGDEIRDIEAAKKTNIRVVGVSWGLNSRKGLLKAGPLAVIEKPLELFTLLNQ